LLMGFVGLIVLLFVLGGFKQYRDDLREARARAKTLGIPPGDFSMTVPAGWGRYEAAGTLSKPAVFRKLSGTIEIKITYGPTRYEDKQVRAKAIQDHLLANGIATTILSVDVRRSFAGEENVVDVRYINVLGQTAGFISVYRPRVDAAHEIQWAAAQDETTEAEEVVESFGFEDA
jgi:hypothetical protein